MILKLFGHENYIRILQALRKESKGLRFTQIQKMINLNPAQVDRALKFFRKEFLIIAHTLPIENGRILIEYKLSKRGVVSLEIIDKLSSFVQKKEFELGKSEVKKFQNLYLNNNSWR